MRFRRRSHRLVLRSVAAGLAGLALATPPALAEAIDMAPGLTEQEQQVLASRGIGAPTAPADIRPAAQPTQSSDASFDWGSAALGAAGAAGLIALVSIGAPALAMRRRVRTAR